MKPLASAYVALLIIVGAALGIIGFLMLMALLSMANIPTVLIVIVDCLGILVIAAIIVGSLQLFKSLETTNHTNSK